MSNQIYMNTDEIKQMASQFMAVGQVLKQSQQTLLVCMTILQTAGIEGLIGDQAMSRYLEGVQPLATSLSERSLELSNTLNQTVTAHVNGDIRISTRFN